MATAQLIPFSLATKAILAEEPSIAYVSGARGQPAKLQNGGALVDLLLSVDGTMTFVQPAGAAAPTLNPEMPGAFFSNVHLQFPNGLDPVQASGFGLDLWRTVAYRAAGSKVSTASLPLPPANSGTSSVTTNEPWHLSAMVPVAITYEDLVGLINTDSDKVNISLSATFNPESSMLDLPSGTTASFSGTVTIQSERFTLPDPRLATWPPFNVIHQLVQQQVSITGTLTTVEIVPGYDILRFILWLENNDALDTGDSLGLTSGGSIELLTNVGETQQLWNPKILRARNAEAYGGALPGGAYVLDFTPNYPAEVLRSYEYSAVKLQVKTTAAPTQPAAVKLVVEQLVDIAEAIA